MDFGDFNIKDFLDRLGAKATMVAVNISPSCEVEILELTKNGLVNNYTKFSYNYNNISKEIENINEFEYNLKTAFADMKLGKSCRVYLSIPTNIIEHVELPLADCSDEEIKEALKTTAENNYIFKKYDPAISFYKTSSDEDKYGSHISICYSAIRQDEYEKITGVFEKLGINVVAVDSSFSALINGVIQTGKVDDNILSDNRFWNIVNITSNSFSVYGMRGKVLNSFYEEPLAVKSFSEDEIYGIIINSLELILNDYPAEQFVFVSQSDNVSAEYLSSQMDVNCLKTFIEDNKFRKQLVEMSPYVVQSVALKVTLEAIGIASWYKNNEGLKFDFLDKPLEIDNSVDTIIIPFNGKDIEVTSNKFIKWLLASGCILLLGFLLASLIIISSKNTAEKRQENIVRDVKKLEAELNVKPQNTGISVEDFLSKSYSNNVNYKKSYVALAREIPDMLWLEEIHLGSDSKLYLAGRAYRMDDILNYFDSLNKLGKFPDLKISTLKISNTEISELLLTKDSDMTEETTYEFAFGQKFFIDPNTVVNDQSTNTNANNVPPPPGSNQNDNAGNASDNVPPAPTNIPKQDS